MQTHKVLLFVFLITVLTFSSSVNVEAQNQTEKFVVVLDAGHGGKDPGKPSKYGYKEKDIALKIVLEVGELLEKNKDIKVVYTRKTDVFIELKERPKIANKAKADLFVSIHCNAHHTQAYGTETYVLDVGNTNRNSEVAKAENAVIFLEDDYEKKYGGFDPNSPESLLGLSLATEEYTEQSILVASLIEENFSKKIKRKSRGVKQASLWVIHQTAMPSVLIETGFVTNKNEGSYLNSRKGQLEISTSIVDAILDYKNVVSQNIGDHVLVKEAIVEEKNIPNTQQVFNNITFKVQIAASSRKLALKPYNFKGLEELSSDKQGNLYKYYYGNTSDYGSIQSLEKTAQAKGYSSSFIVAFKDDKQIPLSEALKTPSN